MRSRVMYIFPLLMFFILAGCTLRFAEQPGRYKPTASRIPIITSVSPAATLLTTRVIVETSTFPPSPTPLTATPTQPAIPQATLTPFPTNTLPPQPVQPTRLPSTPTPEVQAIHPMATPARYTPIKGCPFSYLRAGDVAYISWSGGRNGIRSSPTTSIDNIVGYANQGETVLILGGPKCAENWLLWEVSIVRGLRGWTPEGNGTDYWVLPFPAWQACQGARPSVFQAGDRAYVAFSRGNNAVREQPDKQSNRLDFIEEGEIIDLLEGPRCNDGIVWWKIKSVATGLVGWTAEGDADGEWLVPLKPR